MVVIGHNQNYDVLLSTWIFSLLSIVFVCILGSRFASFKWLQHGDFIVGGDWAILE
jgi:Zn-dependent protease with chaperone function